MIPIRTDVAFCLTLLSIGCSAVGEDETGSASPGSNAGNSNAEAGNANDDSDDEMEAGGGGDDGAGNSGSGGMAGVTDASVADAGEANGPVTVDAGACSVTTQEHPYEGAMHLNPCTPVSYESNPPSSGDHYASWASYGVYQFPLPRGFWVHNLEHGAIVISYNCPEGCAEELATVTSWVNALPVDAICMMQGAIVPRVLLLPDPLLDVRFAASAWLHTLRADCFDEAAFTEFYASNVGNTYETVCSAGVDFRGPDGNPTQALPPGCGE